MKNTIYLIGKELAQHDFKKYGYDSTLNTYINYMEDPIIDYYDENTKEKIKGYCDGFAEIMIEVQNGYYEEVS